MSDLGLNPAVKVPSVIVKIDRRPITTGEPTYVEAISTSVREACKSAGLVIGPHSAVRVNVTYCLDSDAKPGTPIAGRVDHDNLTAVVHTALKEKVGGPLPKNAVIAVADDLKVSAYPPCLIIELQLLDDEHADIGYCDHNAHLAKYGYPPLRAFHEGGVDNAGADVFEFIVPGPIFASFSSDDQVRLFKGHILECWQAAAKACGFPEKINRDELLHITTLMRYSEHRYEDRSLPAVLKITKPDLTHVMKPFNDSFREGGAHNPLMPLIDDDQIAGALYLKVNALPTAFATQGLYVRVQKIKGLEDLQPASDLLTLMDRYEALAKKAAQETIFKEWGDQRRTLLRADATAQLPLFEAGVLERRFAA